MFIWVRRREDGWLISKRHVWTCGRDMRVEMQTLNMSEDLENVIEQICSHHHCRSIEFTLFSIHWSGQDSIFQSLDERWFIESETKLPFTHHSVSCDDNDRPLLCQIPTREFSRVILRRDALTEHRSRFDVGFWAEIRSFSERFSLKAEEERICVDAQMTSSRWKCECFLIVEMSDGFFVRNENVKLRSIGIISRQ